MTDETMAGVKPEPETESAQATGYVEPDPPTRQERIDAALGELQRSNTHNHAPPQALINEIKALLEVV